MNGSLPGLSSSESNDEQGQLSPHEHSGPAELTGLALKFPLRESRLCTSTLIVVTWSVTSCSGQKVIWFSLVQVSDSCFAAVVADPLQKLTWPKTVEIFMFSFSPSYTLVCSVPCSFTSSSDLTRVAEGLASILASQSVSWLSQTTFSSKCMTSLSTFVTSSVWILTARNAMRVPWGGKFGFEVVTPFGLEEEFLNVDLTFWRQLLFCWMMVSVFPTVRDVGSAAMLFPAAWYVDLSEKKKRQIKNCFKDYTPCSALKAFYQRLFMTS